jgi:hypothetical protein
LGGGTRSLPQGFAERYQSKLCARCRSRSTCHWVKVATRTARAKCMPVETAGRWGSYVGDWSLGYHPPMTPGWRGGVVAEGIRPVVSLRSSVARLTGRHVLARLAPWKSLARATRTTRERQSRHQLLALELGSLQCPGADAGANFDERGGSSGDPSRTEPAEQSCSDSASI